MFKIQVQSLIGVVTFTLFDREVKSILKIYAPDLVEKYENVYFTVIINFLRSFLYFHYIFV